MKKTRKSLIASLTTLLLCFAMFVGSTFAWFTDTVSNTGNKIQAGTLKIGLSQYKVLEGESEPKWVDVGKDNDPIFKYDKWEPGYSDSALLKVTNKGNLALKYVLNIKQGEGSALEINEKGHTLADAIDVYSKVITNPSFVMPESFADVKADSSWKVTNLKDALADEDGAIHGILLAKGEIQREGHPEEVAKEATMAIVLHMKEEAGNEYQGLSLGSSFDIELRATQYTYEEDGFGSDRYDLNADGRPDYPEFDEPSVQPVIKKLVVPTNPSNPLIVREPETGESLTVREGDLSVTYTPGAKLKDGTKQAENKKTADAELGFVYESDTSKLGIMIEDSQGVRQWDLDLNIDQNNDYLVKVEKYIGANLDNVIVYHNEKTNKLEKLISEDSTPAIMQKSLGGKEAYFYNKTSGMVVLWVFHSSPVEFIYDKPLSGSGTKEDPYVVADLYDFEKLINLSETGKKYVELNSDIDTTGSTIRKSSYYPDYFNCVIPSMNNVVFEGNNHTIKVDNKDAVFGLIKDSEIKNLKVNFEKRNSSQSFAIKIENSVLSIITFGGVTYQDGNCGLICFYPNNVTLDGCINNTEITGESYNGLFFGYMQGNCIINNCINNGNIIVENFSFFTGNMSYGEKQLVVNNFINNGNVRSTDTKSTDYLFNPVMAATSDKAHQLKLIYDGVEYSGYDSFKDLNINGDGTYTQGPSDAGVSISVNEDNTFKFSKSANDTVAYYKIQVQTAVGVKAGGSGRISAEEIIVSTEASNYDSKLQYLGFYDGTIKTKEIAGNDVITVGGVDYYMNSNERYYVTDSSKDSTKVTVFAFDSKDILVSSTIYQPN